VRRPRVLITSGDPGGIGPELVLRAPADAWTWAHRQPPFPSPPTAGTGEQARAIQVAYPTPAGRQAYDLLYERWATCRRGTSPRGP
jgi:hypothetical protein